MAHPQQDSRLTPFARPQLLVSVRNREEAKVACSQSIGVLDIKEPAAGSLGRATAENVNGILPIATGNIVSVALGELRELDRATIKDYFNRIDSQHISFAKIGLSGSRSHHWQEHWSGLLAEFPDHVSPVAAAYADCDPANSVDPIEVFEAGRQFGCSMALLDTFDKARGGIFDFCSSDQMLKWKSACEELRMGLVLAGSINEHSLDQAISYAPQLIGIRGAACVARDRKANLCASRLKKFNRLLQIKFEERDEKNHTGKNLTRTQSAAY